MSGERVLVVEDEEAFIEALEIGLAREGFELEFARDGKEALDAFAAGSAANRPHDLILLDVMLPRVSGVDVCREIRTTSKVPIIMVTAKSSELDTVVGLEVGADDYVTKPYRLRELVARMRAVMRRTDDGSAATETAPASELGPLRVGEIALDAARHEVTVRGERVSLPLKEFDVLNLLMENAGRVMTRDTLIDRVWGHDYVGDTKTLDVHIKRLRAKVEVNPSKPERIVTIRGLGYKMVLPESGERSKEN